MNISAVRSVFASSVKRWRNHRGLTQEELAERADLHRTYISDVERGARNLSLESIDKLARALGIPLPVLFSPEETPGINRPPTTATESVDIFLVENKPDDVQLTLETFSRARFVNSVRVIADGEEMLELFFGRGALAENVKDPQSQIVLLDLDLPKASGLEVLRQLKADKRTSGIPVVILTVSDKHRDVNECKRLGAEAIITKPINIQGLIKVIPAINLVWTLVKPSNGSPAFVTTATV